MPPKSASSPHFDTLSLSVSLPIFMVVLSLFLQPLFAQVGKVEIKFSLFGKEQLMWPRISGDSTGRGAVFAPVSGVGSEVSASSSKAKDSLSAPQFRIGIVPVWVRDYKESRPCDSCHRLSANGMEFFLENWFRQRLDSLFPAAETELLAPHLDPLVKQGIDLESEVDKMNFPIESWSGRKHPGFIYHADERWLDASTRSRLIRLGKAMEMDYLMIPAQVRVRVKPKSRNLHVGDLAYSFIVVFWDVRGEKAQWAMTYHETLKGFDLDKSLAPNLEQAMVGYWARVPALLRSTLEATSK